MSKTYPLARGGVYWTVNGEGVHVGQPMVFVRFAGCSVGCRECDTDYALFERVSIDELVRRVRQAAPVQFHSTRPWVWLTGGEPTDHNLQPIISALQPWRVALAESANKTQQHYEFLSWRSVSPHRRIEGLHGSEVKFIPGLGRLTWKDVEDFRSWLGDFPYRWLQPLTDNKAEQMRCLSFIQSHPGFRISTQTHKYWGIP